VTGPYYREAGSGDERTGDAGSMRTIGPPINKLVSDLTDAGTIVLIHT